MPSIADENARQHVFGSRATPRWLVACARAERRIAQEHVTQLRPPQVDLPLGTLSGGNQQEVALAKWLAYLPKVLVLCEPTRGMDVGAKDDVVKIVRGLRDAGMAVIVVSTEPETVLSLADRIVVMKKGCIVREFTNEAVSKDRLVGRRVMQATDAVKPPARGSLKDWLRGRLRNIAPFATLLFLVVFFSFSSPSFPTWDNLGNILTQISVTGIIAVGLTFVILCAEIDLSVASIANTTGVVLAYFTLQDASTNIANRPLPGFVAIVLSVVACFALGLVNALGITRIGIPSFIMTLAMLQIGNGITALLVRGQIAYNVPPIVATLGNGSFGPVPWIVICAAITLLIGHLVLTYTRFGRYVYMDGGNREAAEYSGVNVKRIVGSVMIISAVCSGIAGMLGVAHLGSGQQNEFDNYLLDSISAVVVGGTSLFGGQGSIGNTIVGLFVLGVLNNGLDHISIDSFLKVLIRGLILLAALIINVYAQRLRSTQSTTSVSGLALP